MDLVDAAQIDLLERSKRRILLVLYLTAAGLVVLSPLRFVPWLNDAASGKPEYVRILTETSARQLASQPQMQFPVIVEQDEHVSCEAVNAPSISDEETRGILYLLTYSERQHLTCITTYVVPSDSSRFSTFRSVTPAEGKNYGPALLGPVDAVAADRIVHMYAPEYLKRLHWRYKPHFPLSPGEAASLTSRSYYSGVKEVGGSASINFDYEEIRAEVAKHHQTVNLCLSLLLIGCAVLSLVPLLRLALIYRTSSQYCGVYQLKLTARAFLKENIAMKLNAARLQYFEQQRLGQAQLREREKLRALRMGWQESLRSALPNLMKDESQDLEQVKSLWTEVQERTGQATPADKLSLLVESVRPYCTEEEFLAGRAEAFAILTKSGFRAARKFTTTMHDQLKMRARELAELESSEQSVA